VEGFNLFNLAMDYQLRHDLSLSLAIRNLFNAYYLPAHSRWAAPLRTFSTVGEGVNCRLGLLFHTDHLEKPALSPAGKNHPVARSYSPSVMTHPTTAEWIRTPLNDGYLLRAVYLPMSPTGPFRFRYIGMRTLRKGVRKTREIEISRANEMLTIRDFQTKSVSGKIADQMYPVHTAEIMGLAGRILVFISDFIPLTLWITGLRHYRFRKQAQQKSRALKRKAVAEQVAN